MQAKLQDWFEAALGLVYPNLCQICHAERASADDGFVGPRCWSAPGAIRYIQRPYCDRCGLPFAGDITTPFECSNCRELNLQFDFARAAVVAEGMVRDIIHRYKYDRHLWFEMLLGRLLADRAGPELTTADWDMIVPVPLFAARQRQREFNQAERLGRFLQRRTGIPMSARLLRRVKPTQTQTELSRRERAANVRQAFALRKPVSLSGKRIILIDDILTTGATTSACARVLKKAGALRVAVWTVARGL